MLQVGMRGDPPDEWIERLARLFREHPAWVAAAGHLRPEATSDVYFSHRGREPWHLVRGEGGTELRPGAGDDPDFVFRFTPAAIEELEAVEGGVGDFAVALFSSIVEDRVALRIVSGFPRLLRRGYVELLLAAGPRVVAFGATHGVRTLGALRRLVRQLRARGPADWEA